MSKAERQKFDRDPGKVSEATNTLCKWRLAFTGWFLGTRLDGDAQAQAYRDLTDARLMLRAEVSALAALLVEKKVFTAQEFSSQVGVEAEHLSKALEAQFPGMRATPTGLVMDAQAYRTMEGWPA